ncbi:MAG: acetyl-CoA carboxylase biotin carboxylase subunit [Fimbriimonas ginsengisoli]|uniref:biotin carboxylase n=1 Tax=Fimbriimonas ginsengisoli TaxID=1005039 RepID=A0A931PWK9_FIMGI|nr:acetyl-CoA carboxylase biotin carboxylase subunit [Fimbriimonas ginsengisoli]
MIGKVLIANRGEIACRIIRACREMGIRSVAIYSEADRDSLHVKIADEVMCVGGNANGESYLNLANVLMAAQISGADAVHPGYGYFSERPNFASALHSLGIRFIGPTVSAIEAMGDKAKAKHAAIAAKCPVIPGSDHPVADEAQALAEAKRIGFPVLLKAIAGGGGRGIRRVDEPEELPALLQTARAEAQASFGSGEILVEKCLVQPRHVEVQVLGDAHGHVVHLGERECSVQNLRHQKLVEEAPYSRLPNKVRRAMGDAAVRVASSVGYQSAGTVEFLVDKDFHFYFLEMNTRLQVEHTVTEEIAGIDLVKLMLEVAAGRKLPFRQDDIKLKGHAIEARITAQDPDKDFAPSTGLIAGWRAPGGRGVRIETHCYAGFSVSPYYDPLLGKLIVLGRDRDEAVRKLQAALEEFSIEGIATNLPFLRRLCAHPRFVSGEVDTSFVPAMLAEEARGA